MAHPAAAWPGAGADSEWCAADTGAHRELRGAESRRFVPLAGGAGAGRCDRWGIWGDGPGFGGGVGGCWKRGWWGDWGRSNWIWGGGGGGRLPAGRGRYLW